MKIKALSFFVVFFAFVGIGISQNSVTLKFQPPNGTEVNYTLNMTTETVMMGMAMPMKMVMKTKNTMNKKEENQISMGSEIKAVKVSMNMMGQQINYDSENPDSLDAASQQFGSMMGAMVGKSFTILMAPNGEVKKIEGTESLSPAAQGMDFSQMTQGFARFPDKAVSIGDSWNTESSMNNQGLEMNLKTTWTLDEIKDGKAHLKFTTAIDGKPGGGAGGPFQGMSGSIKGKQEGVVWVETKTGITLKTEMEQKTKVDIQGGQSMSVEVNSKVSMVGEK